MKEFIKLSSECLDMLREQYKRQFRWVLAVNIFSLFLLYLQVTYFTIIIISICVIYDFITLPKLVLLSRICKDDNVEVLPYVDNLDYLDAYKKPVYFIASRAVNSPYTIFESNKGTVIMRVDI